MIDPGWPAGGQYLYNLLFAIKAAKLPIETVLRVLPGTPKESYETLNGLFERVFEFPRSFPSWAEKFPQKLRNRLSIVLYPEDYVLRQNNIDAQFMVVNPGNARQV